MWWCTLARVLRQWTECSYVCMCVCVQETEQLVNEIRGGKKKQLSRPWKKCFQLLATKRVTEELSSVALPTHRERQGHTTQLHSIIHPSNAANKRKKSWRREGGKQQRREERKPGRYCRDWGRARLMKTENTATLRKPRDQPGFFIFSVRG